MNLFEEIGRIKEVMNRSSKDESLPIISLENDLVSSSMLLDKLDEKSFDPYQKFILKVHELIVSDNDLDLLPGLQKVIGDVKIRWNAKSLGGLREVEGNFHIGRNRLDNFGNLIYVAGNLDMTNSKIVSETLGNIQFVGGNIKTYRSGITSLGGLKFVGGDADFSHTPLRDLGGLKYVGGTLNLYWTPIMNNSLEEIEKMIDHIDYGSLHTTAKFN